MDQPRTAEELERLWREAEKQRREAEQRAEKERQQRQEAEQKREEAEKRAEKERQQRQEAEQQNRRTTLFEYIEACHQLVFTKLEVETDKRLTSNGSITNPRDKLCPKNLLPWSDFLDQQKTTYGTLLSTFPIHENAFESRNFLQGLGERIAKKKVASEKDLEYFQHISVEDPVRSIIEHIGRIGAEDGTTDTFDIGGGIVFENHPNAISDVSEEVVERRVGRPPETPSQAKSVRCGLRPDQICVYKNSSSDLAERNMVYIIEYKAPHKLTKPHLGFGLRQMDIYTEVVNRVTIPTDKDEKALFQYHADKLAAAAVTQTFHYMIEGGLEYGFLTTGEMIVFLKLDWADPTVLYYHLADPNEEVLAHPNNSRYCTAVSQIVAFSLMALKGQRHGQEERQSAARRLQTWREDYEAILRSIPESERKAPPSSGGYVPKTYKNVDRSPYILRKNKRKQATDLDGPDVHIAGRNQSPESSDDEPGTQLPDTPTPTEAHNRRGLAERSRSNNPQQTRDNNPHGSSSRPPYCTQKCLLGLVGGGPFDRTCPNIILHRREDGGSYHPVSYTRWLQLLKEQLSRTLDDGLWPLGKQGARGVLFQVTLLVYGYTFVAKGTVPEFVEDLEYEATVYYRLRPLQGVSVPVFLGAVDLRDFSRTYYYDFRVRIIYMMFLSWGGQSLEDTQALDTTKATQELIRSLQEFHAYGIAHTDVREPNILWNREIGRVMIIDFERAVSIDVPRQPLAQVMPNESGRTPQCYKTTAVEKKRNDILAASLVLRSLSKSV